jgi:cytochrome c oxidase cbb3-type subunit 1
LICIKPGEKGATETARNSFKGTTMQQPNPPAAAYDDTVVRQFALMSVVWGVVGMLVGVIIASQLTWPELNLGIPWLGYGRLRPLHTNAVIFAFGGCALMATSFHVVQRTCQVRLFAPKLATFVFWGWQVVIVAAAISLPMGYTSGKEYAELEWPIDILIAAVWVAYAIVFFGTIGIRKVRHIYVANWFFGAFIIAVALLHIVNSAAIPGGLDEELLGLRRRAGRDGAVVVRPQRGGLLPHRGLPGMMYYYIPKQAEPAGVFVPLVHRPLLGADLHLHVGRPAPPALHRAARLDAVAGHGVLADPAGAQLGRNDQRRDDALGRLAQAARPTRFFAS